MSEQAEQTSGEPGSPLAEPIVSKPAAGRGRAGRCVARDPDQHSISQSGARTGPDRRSAGGEGAGSGCGEPTPRRQADDHGPRRAQLGRRRRGPGSRGPEAFGPIRQAPAGGDGSGGGAGGGAGALGGALATASFGHPGGDAASTAGNHALEASVARIDADVAALKASVEHTSKMGVSQFNKTSDRLDKLEKAQAEPAAKLARLSEAVEKLHAAPPAPAAAAAPQAASKEVTGSVTPAAPALVAAPKSEVARLPTIDDWILRDVSHGGALIEGRRGVYEVYAGDPVPGLGRIDAIRRQDGRWVVVTSRGLIVER